MCKTKYGKTILLSIGGDSAKISFASEEEAKQNARDIWHMFGATPASKFDTTKPRPFGHAVIDGIDIDVESETKYLKDWAQEMRALTTKDNSYFTAAPQCPKEEDPMNEVMSNVAFDAAFVQFYNTPKCMFGGPNHDDTITKWNTWAEGLPNTTFFMGLPGSDSATTNPGTGYLAPDTMKDAVKKAKSFSKFSGVMLWDMSQVVGNDNYHLKVRTALDAQ
jgi:chitinase